jgi:hypothetical protein
VPESRVPESRAPESRALASADAKSSGAPHETATLPMRPNANARRDRWEIMETRTALRSRKTLNIVDGTTSLRTA